MADLPLEVERYELSGLRERVASDFERHTTIVRLLGGGVEGLGEDVNYDRNVHLALQQTGPVLPLSGSWDLDGFSNHLDRLDLFSGTSGAGEPDYRRWAFEAAALDLALGQAGQSLAGRLALTPKPFRFVVSPRLGRPPTARPVSDWLRLYPSLRFKLDATSGWDSPLIEQLVATGAVDVIDFKGQYKGTSVDQPADAALYERVARAFPDAWLEDPALEPSTDAVLAPHRSRIAWDAPIHSVEEIRALAFAPRALNIKPSRFGSLRRLCEAYDYCNAERIRIYGGGQFELGAGRGQIQYLAALFHPDAPNDLAPQAYNVSVARKGLPESPLAPRPRPTGFQRISE